MIKKIAVVGSSGAGKTFVAHMDIGEVRKMTAQVTQVNKCVLSVSRVAKSGNRVVFEEGSSNIENKATGHVIPLEEKGGMYVLRMWVEKDQKTPF